MKITLLIPTLNEIEGMKQVMPKIKKEWVDQILIVDGHSTDGTVEYAREQGYSVILQKNKGIRHAYIEAIEHIEGDVVITFSPDGNSIPELILPLIEKMKQGQDMVIVSRYAKGAKSYDDDLITSFGNWMFTSLINLFYGAKYTDAMVMFRAWRKEIFINLDLDKEESYIMEEKIFRTKIGVEPLLSVRAAKRKLKCADIPGDEPVRIGGERKLQVLRWGAAYLMQTFKEVFYWH
ncbi:MAG: glycosyltransferase family 2 protein [Candidatus Omnitrophica bacterium]|nr:glycosyltransferase family 2 protein [Candidatus Omnitrophota bacterium]